MLSVTDAIAIAVELDKREEGRQESAIAVGNNFSLTINLYYPPACCQKDVSI